MVFLVSSWESFALFSTDNCFESSVLILLLLQNLLVDLAKSIRYCIFTTKKQSITFFCQMIHLLDCLVYLLLYLFTSSAVACLTNSWSLDLLLRLWWMLVKIAWRFIEQSCLVSKTAWACSHHQAWSCCLFIPWLYLNTWVVLLSCFASLRLVAHPCCRNSSVNSYRIACGE